MTGRALQVAQDMGLTTVVTLTDFWFLCKQISMVRSDGTLSTLPIDPIRCARCIGEEQRRFRWLGRVMPNVIDAYWRRQDHAVHTVKARSAYLLETLRRVDAIISPSQFLRQTFIAAGVAPEQILFMRQGHDSFKTQTSPLPIHKPARSVLRVAYLGQIAPLKGVHVLFEAVRAMPDAPIEVKAHGDPKTHPDYTARLHRCIGNDKRIRMMGLYQRSELSAVLLACDVVVVPSLWYENSPNVILEAFAHGVPVIATNLGGMAELVRPEVNGLCFEQGSAADLSRQLGRLIREPGLLDNLCRGATKSNPLSLDQEMDSLCDLYRRLIWTLSIHMKQKAE